MVEHANPVLDSVFHALADPTRRAILRDVARREKSVGDLAQPFAMSLAAVSKHLDVLERADLINRERRGTCRIVRLNPARLKAAQEWIAFYQHFWNSSLDRLQKHLEEPEPATTRPAKKEK